MEEGNLTGKIADDVKSYVGMRVDSVKLQVVEGLSTTIGKAIGIIVAVQLFTLALMLITAMLVFLLSKLTGLIWAALIMGVIYVVAGIIVLRSKMFINLMVPMFSKMFFEHKKKRNDE